MKDYVEDSFDEDLFDLWDVNLIVPMENEDSDETASENSDEEMYFIEQVNK